MVVMSLFDRNTDGSIKLKCSYSKSTIAKQLNNKNEYRGKTLNHKLLIIYRYVMKNTFNHKGKYSIQYPYIALLRVFKNINFNII